MKTTECRPATPANRTLLQSFEWHTPSTPPSPQETHSPLSHYARLHRLIPIFAGLGITTIWLPPGCKANNPGGNGYDCYDLWDLGEFDQKWTKSTKWGSREELDELIATTHDHGLEIIWDAVLNHKTAGDATDECWAVEVDPHDRRIETCHPRKIEAWLKFDFPGRAERYSSLKWRAEHFNGTDWDQKNEKHAIFKLIDDPATAHPSTTRSTSREPSTIWSRIRHVVGSNHDTSAKRLQHRLGKGWAIDVDDMHGNNDYLMFSNVDYTHPDVRQDTIQWSLWMLQQVGVNGFRLDAATHFSWTFTKELVGRIQRTSGHSCFVVGEIWTPDVWRITKWLDAVGQGVYAFDAPLLMAFSRLSQAAVHGQHKRADLRKLERGTLLGTRPDAAVTVVGNHDTQHGQASYMPMDGDLKTLFYAYILLRKSGVPCVFWGDLFGTQGPQAEPAACLRRDGIGSVLPDLVMARELFAYGEQKDYFDNARCIAWSRRGTHDRPGCVVMLSIEPYHMKTHKKIAAGEAGQVWIDILATARDRTVVKIDIHGFGIFVCSGRRAAVYVAADNVLTNRFPVPFDPRLGR